MPTTESIITGLTAERDEHQAAGRLAEVRRVDQEVIAHQTLARLRAERDAHLVAGDKAAAAGVDEQIGYWVRQVDVDAGDEPAPAAVEPTTAASPDVPTVGDRPRTAKRT